MRESRYHRFLSNLFIGDVALYRNPGLVYNTLFLRLIPGDLYSAFSHKKFHTLPLQSGCIAQLLASNLIVCAISREAVCTMFIFFGMTRPGHEPTAYRMRGGHA